MHTPLWNSMNSLQTDKKITADIAKKRKARLFFLEDGLYPPTNSKRLDIIKHQNLNNFLCVNFIYKKKGVYELKILSLLEQENKAFQIKTQVWRWIHHTCTYLLSGFEQKINAFRINTQVRRWIHYTSTFLLSQFEQEKNDFLINLQLRRWIHRTCTYLLSPFEQEKNDFLNKFAASEMDPLYKYLLTLSV